MAPQFATGRRADFLPDLIAMAVIVGVILYLYANADKTPAKKYTLKKL